MEHRIGSLEYKLEKAIRERDAADEKLFWAQQNLKTCQARLSEFERQRARAYDAYVTAPQEASGNDMLEAERDALATENARLREALAALCAAVDNFRTAFEGTDWEEIVRFAASSDLNIGYVLFNQTDLETLANSIPDTIAARALLDLDNGD